MWNPCICWNHLFWKCQDIQPNAMTDIPYDFPGHCRFYTLIELCLKFGKMAGINDSTHDKDVDNWNFVLFSGQPDNITSSKINILTGQKSNSGN